MVDRNKRSEEGEYIEDERVTWTVEIKRGNMVTLAI